MKAIRGIYRSGALKSSRGGAHLRENVSLCRYQRARATERCEKRREMGPNEEDNNNRKKRKQATHPFASRIYGLKAYLSFLLELIGLQSLPNFVGGRIQEDRQFP
jgi:hypothetical protein